MRRLHAECSHSEPSDPSLPSDILLREEPEDEEEDEEKATKRKMTTMGTKATQSERVLDSVGNDEARTFRQGSRRNSRHAARGISQSHSECCCSGRRFAAEPAISEAGATRAAASGHLSWRAHHQEEHIRLAERTRSHRPLSEEH